MSVAESPVRVLSLGVGYNCDQFCEFVKGEKSTAPLTILVLNKHAVVFNNSVPRVYHDETDRIAKYIWRPECVLWVACGFL